MSSATKLLRSLAPPPLSLSLAPSISRYSTAVPCVLDRYRVPLNNGCLFVSDHSRGAVSQLRDATARAHSDNLRIHRIQPLHVRVHGKTSVSVYQCPPNDPYKCSVTSTQFVHYRSEAGQHANTYATSTLVQSNSCRTRRRFAGANELNDRTRILGCRG